MTVKLIAKGLDYESRIYREKCDFCQGIVEFDGEDAFPRMGIGKWLVVSCPTCGLDVQAAMDSAAQEFHDTIAASCLEEKEPSA